MHTNYYGAIPTIFVVTDTNDTFYQSSLDDDKTIKKCISICIPLWLTINSIFFPHNANIYTHMNKEERTAESEVSILCYRN